MRSSQIVLLIINSIMALLVGHFIGKKRHIGFGWSVIVCLGTSAIIGTVIALISPKLNTSPHKPTKTKRVVGIIMIIWGILGFLEYFEKSQAKYQNIDSFSAGCLLITIGMYLYHLSKQGDRL